MLMIGRKGIIRTGPERREIRKRVPAVVNVQKVLSDNMWKGSPCVIIGGGESIQLQKLDLRKLKGHLIIAINKSFAPPNDEYISTIIYSMDTRCWGWIESGKLGAGLKDKFINMPSIKIWLYRPEIPLPSDIFRIACAGPSMWGSSIAQGIGGCHSGFGALNLACLLGANPIYLLGYDMKGKNGKQAWWHGKYPVVQNDTVFAHYKKIIEQNVGKMGNVINLNPDSALKCFKFGDYSSLPAPKKFPRIIAYYTKNTPYEKEVESLRLSVQALGLEHDIVGIPSLGKWELNCARKASFIIDELSKFPGEPLLYVDADAVFLKRPYFFETLKDKSHVYIRKKKSGFDELISATIYLPGNSESMRLMQAWQLEQANLPEVWDQKVLQLVLDNKDNGFAYERLPHEYCHLFDDRIHLIDNPVIVQNQASRRLKKLV